MDFFLRDLRFAVRNLRKHPTFSLVAVVTIALGIGANTAIFSVVNGVLLRDLPYEAPDELVRIWSTNMERGVPLEFMSPPDISDYQDQNRTFTDVAAYSEAELAMIDRNESAIKVTGTWAGDNLFQVLGAKALMGRTFLPEDGEAGAPTVMILAHGFWQSRFGGDPGVIGESLVVEEASYTVVGVMPPGFDFPGNSSFWLNRYLLAYPGRYARWMDVVGRMGPGVGIEAARADFAGIAGRLEEQYPGTNRAYTTTLIPLHEAVVGETRAPLLILLGATGLLLLIACANVTNLLLARMADRGREIAVRTAMGAGRVRLSRQMLTESLVLAGTGAIVGLLLARGGIDVLIALGPENLPRLEEVRFDRNVFLFTLGSTFLTGLLFGLAPVLRLAGTDVQGVLKEGGRSATVGSGRERLRSGLVMAEIALAVMVVVGAGLLVRSFSELMDTDPGFNAGGVLTLQVEVPTGSYQENARVVDYYSTLTQRLTDVPGVESVAATAALPFANEIPFLGNFVVQDRAAPMQGEEPTAHYRQVTPGYFRTMGIDLIEGREFDIQDDATSRGVVVVNEALARRYFPDEDPIGRTIDGLPPHIALGGFLVDQFEIVGIAEDVRYFGLTEAAQPSLYFPVAQAPFRRMNFTIRTAGVPEGLIAAIRGEIVSMDPTVPIAQVQTMERILSSSVARDRFSMLLLTLFAVIALVLASVGIYGVTSYSIAQRTAEMGIRMAVGANPSDVMKLVMVNGARLTLSGIVLGLLGAAALSRIMASQLYGVGATDPLTFAGVALILAAVALAATYVPALRAARIDPVLAIQGDGH
jgi:putative ABC transport system permease protein